MTRPNTLKFHRTSSANIDIVVEPDTTLGEPSEWYSGQRVPLSVIVVKGDPSDVHATQRVIRGLLRILPRRGKLPLRIRVRVSILDEPVIQGDSISFPIRTESR